MFYTVVCNGQTTDFDAMLERTLQKTVPFITSNDLADTYDSYTILDAREIDEYNVSHLNKAIHVGFSHFNTKTVSKLLPKETPIVVYCTIGYRSEKVAEKLLAKGYKVYNLYGGIFDWKNNKNTVVNSLNMPTEKIHCYNSDWSKWLLNGEKIYD